MIATPDNEINICRFDEKHIFASHLSGSHKRLIKVHKNFT